MRQRSRVSSLPASIAVMSSPRLGSRLPAATSGGRGKASHYFSFCLMTRRPARATSCAPARRCEFFRGRVPVLLTDRAEVPMPSASDLSPVSRLSWTGRTVLMTVIVGLGTSMLYCGLPRNSAGLVRGVPTSTFPEESPRRQLEVELGGPHRHRQRVARGEVGRQL